MQARKRNSQGMGHIKIAHVLLDVAIAIGMAGSCTAQHNTVVPSPTITSAYPAALPMGENNTIILTGSGFVPGTVILLDGSASKTEYQSPTSVHVTLSAEPGVASPLTIVAQNPGFPDSSAFPLPLATPPTTKASIGIEPVLTIPKAFLGLSQEWGDAQGTMGQSSRGANLIIRKLISNLMDGPDSPFLIRIGGGSTDNTTHIFDVQPFNEIHAALPGVRFSLGVTLGKSIKRTPDAAVAQAKSYVANMTPGSLDSLELGNETDVYQYQSGPINGQCRDYTFDVFNKKSTEWISRITEALGPATPKFTGASWSLFRSLVNNEYWSGHVPDPPSYLENFIAAQKSSLSSIAQHYYAGMVPGSFPPSYLLSSEALQYKNPGHPVLYWVPSILGWAAGVAHKNGQIFRMNEMNSVDEGGMPGTSDSFASALWAIDTMFEFANAGVDGVNWHGAHGGERITTPGATCDVQHVVEQAPCTPRPIYAAYTFHFDNQAGRTTYSLDSVNPLYYGFYFFHLAVPDGAQLLPVTLESPASVKVWATKDPSGTIRIAVINKDTKFSGDVSIGLPRRGDAKSLLLSDAHGYAGTIYYPTGKAVVGITGITIGGQTFDGSTDGSIQGKQTVGVIHSGNGIYKMKMQPASAVLLTLAAN